MDPGPPRRALIIAVLVLGGGGFLPLFGGPGYESALLAGVVLPSTAAIATAVGVVAGSRSAASALGSGLAFGTLLATVGAAITMLHGLRVGFCDPTEGLVLFALGPGFGSAMGGAWGAAVGLVLRRPGGAPRRGLCVVLSLAGPLGGIAVSVWRFASSPMIFAYDPFFGYFAGTLYDTIIDDLDGLVTYRAGSALTVLAALWWSRRLHAGDGRWALDVGNALSALPGVALVAGSVAHSMAGPELGHWQTAETTRRALGRELSGARCDVVHSWRVPAWDAALFLRECDAHVVEIERWLGVPGPERVRAFLFASAAEKGELMGAADTYIAKPWRAETYLQAAGFPHPVLGHELVHVVSASIGRGPFRVSGPLGGWIPDPGRIEGLAVAASPPPDDDLTLQQWARSMKDLGLLPRVESLFRLSFLGEPSSRAYTVAGAFVEWLQATRGSGVVTRWYGGGDLRTLTGRDLRELEVEWHESLGKELIDDRAREVGRARFDRPSVFGRSCPHVVDRYLYEGREHLGAFDAAGAREAFTSALDLDPGSLSARYGLADCALRSGDREAARHEFGAIAADEALHRASRVRGQEALGDLALADGRLDEARRWYAAASAIVVDEDQLRALEVKASVEQPVEREAIVALLVGDSRLGHDWGLAASLLASWAEREPEAGLPRYLLGKNLVNRGRFREAALHLDAALAKRLAPGRVRREALASRLTVACAERDRATLDRLAPRALSDPELAEARRRALERFLARCR